MRTRTQEVESDKKGWWIISKIEINNLEIYIINIYQVGNRKTGPSKIARQQINYDYDNGLPFKHPRKAFIDDFLNKLREYRSKFEHIFIFGDLNETTTGREMSNQRICEIGFINIFQYRLKTKLPSTTAMVSEGIDQA